MSGALFFTLLLGIIPAIQMDVYDECITINCLGMGSKTCLQDRNCQSIVGLLYNYPSKELNIMLYTTNGNKYISLGLSEGDQMGNDDVVACFRNNQDGVVVYFGRTYRTVRVDESKIVLNPTTDFPGFKMDATNGGLSCQWRFPTSSLPLDFKFKGFDKNETYDLFAALGDVRGSSPKYTLGFHHRDFALSARKLNFGNVNRITPGVVQRWEHKIHILCMIWAWMFFIPVGVIIARYYKETWAKVRVFRRRLWFILHILITLLGLIFCIAGYIPILIKNRSSFLNPLQSTGLPVHQWIGFTAIILYVLQAIPKWFYFKNLALRRFVSGGHAFLGITCYVVGFFNIVTAHIFTFEVLPLENNLQFVGIVSIAILLIFFIFLSASYSWVDGHLGVDIRRAFCYFPLPISSDEEAPRPYCRKMILYTFILLSFGMSTINTAFMFTWTGYQRNN